MTSVSIERVLAVFVGVVLVVLGGWGLAEFDAGGNLAWVIRSIPALAALAGAGLITSALQRSCPFGRAVAYVVLGTGLSVFVIGSFAAVTGLAALDAIFGGFFAGLGILGVVVGLLLIATGIRMLGTARVSGTGSG